MTVYNTAVYVSLEHPLNTVTVCHPNIRNELYRGPFEKIPRALFNREVIARVYEYTTKSLKVWVRS